ncbi:BamA/TamA family outer membrane protein [Adhaeribacter aquaticus]|uniref:BamA/TamA family outer membrane protein n=1 Tax=Adhaeribacter aquaticus TaxID=299567 RepID=UPI000684069C|nr:BamA/TamA family outer membrane protein [Adhaeribacter aquaticus]
MIISIPNRKYLVNQLVKIIPRVLFLLLVLQISFSEAQGQSPNFISRYIKKIVNDTTHTARPQFLFYPTLGYSPETSLEMGISGLYVYYANGDTTNRLSEMNGFGFYTLQEQYGLIADHNLYSNHNKWAFPGRIRYQSFPVLYHGIGPESPPEQLAEVNSRQLQIRERALRQTIKNLYFGLEVDYQRLSSVNFDFNSDEPFALPLGGNGSKNLAFGLGILYDTRHNVLNVRNGQFSELAFLKYNTRWGGDYNFSTIISDNRFYRSLNKKHVLAAQVLGQFTTGNTPFNMLALMGGENMMRGYYAGRYRDKNQVAAQAEYRLLPLPFSKRWGATFFVSTGTVFNTFTSFNYKDFVVAGGGGIRYLLFPKKDIFTRLDVAFTKEKPGFYIFIGEAF